MWINDIWSKIVVEYDSDTKQWYIYNDNTPGIYSTWETKKEAFLQYLDVLKESIQVDFTKSFLNNETHVEEKIHQTA